PPAEARHAPPVVRPPLRRRVVLLRLGHVDEVCQQTDGVPGRRSPTELSCFRSREGRTDPEVRDSIRRSFVFSLPAERRLDSRSRARWCTTPSEPDAAFVFSLEWASSRSGNPLASFALPPRGCASTERVPSPVGPFRRGGSRRPSPIRRAPSTRALCSSRFFGCFTTRSQPFVALRGVIASLAECKQRSWPRSAGRRVKRSPARAERSLHVDGCRRPANRPLVPTPPG